MPPALVLSALAGTLLLAVQVLQPAPAAWAVGRTQTELCSTGRCSITASAETINQGGSLVPTVRGKGEVDVALTLYLVTYDSSGKVTGLLPAAGQPVRGRTRLLSNGGGSVTLAALAPQPPAAHREGGWLFLGLADDTSTDLRTRLGRLVAYGGDTVRALGDGFAQQKPIGQELRMEVVGHVNGASYWVEYQLPDGTWVPVDGRGNVQRLTGSPAERRTITYHVPAELTSDRPYPFRVNSTLNVDPANPDRPVADPAYAEWTVVPSPTPRRQEPGQGLDPGAGPAGPSPSPSPSPTPTPTPGPKPTTAPQPTPSADRSHQPTGGEGVTPSTDPGPPAPSGSAAPTLVPAPSPDPDAPVTQPAGTVWGEEATPESGPGPVVAASTGTSRLLGALGLLLVAAPALWWVVGRRRAAREPGESLR